MRNLSPVLVAAFLMTACAAEEATEIDPEGGAFEGVEEDNDPNSIMDDGKSDLPAYQVPTGLPKLVKPEIIISLQGLTVHLFDRETGFSEVYPTGVGVKGSNGRSITPTGHFRTSSNINDVWWYVARRTSPEYFHGLPFLRIDAKNSLGQNTYAMHGPVTEVLQRGYVSHGCARMARNDIIRLFWLVKGNASTPVTIQQETELDAAGAKVDVGKTAKLFAVGEQIKFGASVGPRPW